MAIENRVNQLEGDIKKINITMTCIASDFKFIKEKIQNYLETHDLVIRQEEKLKIVNTRIKELEVEQKKHAEKITNMAIKVALVSGTLSTVVSFVYNMIKT